MGFLSGRVSFCRFRVGGDSPGLFGPEHLEALDSFAAGKQKLASADGIETGWTACAHILDTRFDQAKNVVADCLHFGLRTDQLRLPGDLMRAYYQIELAGLAANNPSGLPSALNKREAREAARDRLEQEAKDGRYTKRKVCELLWDSQSNELLVGSTSMTTIDQVMNLFDRTFNRKCEPITSGKQAFELASAHQNGRMVDDASPSPFTPTIFTGDVAWIVEETSRDYLGNEFLMWLWYVLESETDTIKLGDESDVAVMMARTLALECPRGQTGKETISSEGPTRLPEARRAVQSGKWPRKCGLTLARHGLQYELSLQAETLAVGGAKLPAPEEGEEQARLEERVGHIRSLIETLDLLYDAFGKFRFDERWERELNKVQRWLLPDRLAA